MKVYVLEAGIYDSCRIEGVFASLELAKAAFPHGEWKDYEGGGAYSSKSGFEADISPFDLQESSQ